jgi:hypothetical protein
MEKDNERKRVAGSNPICSTNCCHCRWGQTENGHLLFVGAFAAAAWIGILLTPAQLGGRSGGRRRTKTKAKADGRGVRVAGFKTGLTASHGCPLVFVSNFKFYKQKSVGW